MPSRVLASLRACFVEKLGISSGHKFLPVFVHAGHVNEYCHFNNSFLFETQVGNPGQAGVVAVKTVAKEIKVVLECAVPKTVMAQRRKQEHATNTSVMVRETSIMFNEAFF